MPCSPRLPTTIGSPPASIRACTGLHRSSTSSWGEGARAASRRRRGRRRGRRATTSRSSAPRRRAMSPAASAATAESAEPSTPRPRAGGSRLGPRGPRQEQRRDDSCISQVPGSASMIPSMRPSWGASSAEEHLLRPRDSSSADASEPTSMRVATPAQPASAAPRAPGPPARRPRGPRARSRARRASAPCRCRRPAAAPWRRPRCPPRPPGPAARRRARSSRPAPRRRHRARPARCRTRCARSARPALQRDHDDGQQGEHDAYRPEEGGDPAAQGREAAAVDGLLHLAVPHDPVRDEPDCQQGEADAEQDERPAAPRGEVGDDGAGAPRETASAVSPRATRPGRSARWPARCAGSRR